MSVLLIALTFISPKTKINALEESQRLDLIIQLQI